MFRKSEHMMQKINGLVKVRIERTTRNFKQYHDIDFI
jgi:hypothetical protein